jgi:hypothetical protein
VQVGIFLAQTGGAERKMFNDRARRLTVDEVPIGQGVLEASRD